MAMLAVDDWLGESKINARLIMQVHDELVFEVEAGAVDDLRTTVCQLMSDVGVLDVPLLVEAGPPRPKAARPAPLHLTSTDRPLSGDHRLRLPQLQRPTHHEPA